MTPDIYEYPAEYIDNQIIYKYLAVFEKDQSLGVTYANGPFCFYVETNDVFDRERLDFALLGLRSDPIEVVVIYDGLELYQVDPPSSLAA